MCFRRKKPSLTTLSDQYQLKFPEGASVHFLWENVKVKGATLWFGNGESVPIPSRSGGITRKIKQAGRLRATIRDANGKTIAGMFYTLPHVPPKIHQAFIVGQLQLLNPVLIDTNYQEHGCSGGGTAVDKYGIENRLGERVRVAIEVKMGSLTVYSDYEDNARLVQWHIGAEDPPHFPADKPVLTPTGLWRPGDPLGTPTPSCGADDPKQALIIVKARNQFGSEAFVTQRINWRAGEGEKEGQQGGCTSGCSRVR